MLCATVNLVSYLGIRAHQLNKCIWRPTINLGRTLNTLSPTEGKIISSDASGHAHTAGCIGRIRYHVTNGRMVKFTIRCNPYTPQMYQLNKLQTESRDKGSLTHGGGTTIHRHKTRRETEIQRGTPETHNSQTPRTHNSQTPRNSQFTDTRNSQFTDTRNSQFTDTTNSQFTHGSIESRYQ